MSAVILEKNGKEASADGWQAHLELQYENQAGRTVLSKRSHHGPLLVQRPFYPEAPVCHSYIIHPPGGIAGGDQLQIDVQVADGAHALLTTPASGKFYNSLHKPSSMQQNLSVANGAKLEWLPQDNIFFEDSRSITQTQITLHGDAVFIGWEIVCLGRPFCDQTFRGDCTQKLVLQRDGINRYIDRTVLQADEPVLSSRWGLNACTVSATMLATPACEDELLRLRDAFKQTSNFEFSATLLDDILVCRFLGHHGAQAREVFEQAWTLIRPAVMGRKACSPRIWKT